MSNDKTNEAKRYQVFRELFDVLVKHNLPYWQATEFLYSFSGSFHCLIINNFKAECNALRLKTMQELEPLFGKTFEQGKLET